MKSVIKNRSIKGKSLDELKDLMLELNEQKFRAEQIFNWIYNKNISNYDEMVNIPKSLRNKLSENFEINTLEKITSEYSKLTGTEKFLFKTFDGRNIESVVIPEKERKTLCISTQVGCPLDCKFCATGLMGYKRNLTAGEIIDQYLLAAKDYDAKEITNIVYMGMGEPLLNYEETLKSLTIFTHELSTGISRNRITISTSGIPHKIKELADTGLRVKLAFSLHSTFEDIRSKIMPINEKYSLEKNLDAIKYYAKETKTRITFEYTMLEGINDRDEDIKGITKICASVPSKINIIPFNSIKHMSPDGISAELEPTPFFKIQKFADKLRDKNITVMLRETQGDDIAAACGQLAVKF